MRALIMAAAAIALLAAFSNGPAEAQESTSGASQTGHSQVTYVTADGFYIGAGSDRGIAAGDTITVFSGEDIVATGVVQFVSATSSSCSLLEGEVDVGQRVEFALPAGTDESEAEAGLETDEPVQARRDILPGAMARTRREPVANDMDGRVGVQLRLQTDEETGHDVMEPGLSIRLRVRNLFGSDLALNVRARSRRIIRDREVGADLYDEWNNRIYEVALEYDTPVSPLGYRVGRIYANRISGIGGFDGAYVDYAVAEAWTVGVFGGLQPDSRTSRISSDDTKAGAFISHSRGDWSGRRLDATLAVAGAYHTREIDREFFYQQLRYSFGRTLSLYESAEISINRGWREQAEGSSFSLDNVLLSAYWNPSDQVTVNAGYDNRQILRTWQTKDTPDSIFDDASRTGWRAGLSWRGASHLFASVQGNYRTREGDSADDVVSAHVRAGQRGLFGSDLVAEARLAYYDSRFTVGLQPSLAFSAYPVAWLRTSLEGGLRRYEYDSAMSSSQDTQLVGWVRPEFGATIGRNWYGRAYAEFTRGDMESSNRYFLEAGYRL